MRTNNFTEPTINSDFAWFIGYLLGDGHISNAGYETHIAVDSTQTETIQKVANGFKLFGLEAQVKKYKNACAYYVRCSNKSLNSYLSQFKTSNTELKIPKFVWEGDINIKLNFLAGLFDADGSCKRPDGSIRFSITTVYERFAHELTQLIEELDCEYTLKAVYRPLPRKTLYKVNVLKSKTLATLIFDMSEKIRKDYNF